MSESTFEIICNSCRGAIASDAAACPSCGVSLFGPGRQPFAPAAVRGAPAVEAARPAYATAGVGLSASGYAVAAARQAIAAGSYAGFWIRLVAAVVDAVLVGVALAAVYSMAGQRPAVLAAACIGLLYHPLMESSGSRGTLGKIFCGLTVADLSGRRIPFGQALGRNLARILCVLTLGIGYLMIGWTRRKQGLHDLVAGTIVLRQ